ncbi:fimbrial protein [Citrobacter amalonaticus]|nr:fimbrial protein [Citrobacter amalonaticus]
MCKFIFALFIALLSLCSLPAMAGNCSGGSISFEGDPSDGYYWQMNGYTSANDDPLLIMQVNVKNGMSCDPDYVEYTQGMGKMTMQITSGGTCKNTTTITTPYPGIEWELEGMSCNDNTISSNNIKSGGWDSKIDWPSGTNLGKVRLIVRDQYWIQNTTSTRTINIPALSFGSTLINSPSVSVTSTLGSSVSFQVRDTATCSMSLSTENLDFGKLTPTSVNNNSLYKELSIYYSCKNKALINGLYVRFDPENVVNSTNGMFSANDNNGRKLNFQITRVYGNEHVIPLNANYQIYQPSEVDLDATATFRINVRPSTPFPAGKVSTYMNVSLIYR